MLRNCMEESHPRLETGKNEDDLITELYIDIFSRTKQSCMQLFRRKVLQQKLFLVSAKVEEHYPS